jgi:hypothetical protein
MPTKSKKTEAAEVASEPSVRHSIPAMGERTKGGPSSVIQRHKRKHTPSAAKVKDSERPVVEISESTQAKFVKFSCTKQVFDLVEETKKIQQKEVSSEIYEKFVDSLWISKCQPANPNIVAKMDGKIDATGQFIVSAGSKIKIEMPECEDDEEPEDALVRGLVNAGVSPHNAESLVSSEVSFVPNWSLGFTDLMRGEVREGKINAPTQTQSSAAEILFCAINGEDLDGNQIGDDKRLKLLGSISAEGWEALKSDIDKRTTYFPILVDSKDFLDRVCRYADSRDELRNILAVFSPTYYCQRVVFAPNDSEASKKSRMVTEAKSIVTK